MKKDYRWKKSAVPEFGDMQMETVINGITVFIYRNELGSFGARSSDGNVMCRGAPTSNKAKKVVHAIMAAK